MLCILPMEMAIGSDAAAYPRRQPVMAKPLEKPLSVMVRSNMPGSEAKLTISPSNKMYS